MSRRIAWRVARRVPGQSPWGVFGNFWPCGESNRMDRLAIGITYAVFHTPWITLDIAWSKPA